MMDVFLKTLANLNITLQGTFERDTQGDGFKMIGGDKGDFVKGLRLVTTVANGNEINLGGKNEEVWGLELKYTRPRLSENFFLSKNSVTIAVTFESNSEDREKFSPTTSTRQQSGATAMSPHVQELTGKTKEKYERLVARGTKLAQKMTTLTTKATTIQQQASKLKAEVSVFDGQWGDVVWKADKWTEACSGAYTVDTGKWEVDSKGAVEIKGSTVKVRHSGLAGVECAGGKVKIGRHLVIS